MTAAEAVAESADKVAQDNRKFVIFIYAALIYPPLRKLAKLNFKNFKCRGTYVAWRFIAARAASLRQNHLI